MTSDEEYQNMMQKSERFLLNAERNLDDDFVDIGAFSANQALELFLMAQLLEKLGDFPHTHDLKLLMRNLAGALNGKKQKKVEDLLSEKSLILSTIQDAYIMSRYFFTSLTREDLETMIREVRDIEQGLSDVC